MLTINPAVDLVAGKSYAVRIAAGAVVDASGNGFAGILDDWSLEFLDGTEFAFDRAVHRKLRGTECRGIHPGHHSAAWVKANQGFGGSSARPDGQGGW